ncbi:hypothetical protein L1887_36218 [Cichorium endivia]|nr:hypothetical protein L1887_36218 [Cichorium endivia]
MAQQVDYMSGHEFLQFPDALEETHHYQARLWEISTRPVLPSICFDRALLTQMGLWDQLLPFLHLTWTHLEGAFTFTCQDWERHMAMTDDIAYKELMLEFFSTCVYTLVSREPRANLVRFRLGGQSRECTLWEFARKTGIYTEAEVGSIHFPPFLTACFSDHPPRAGDEVLWAEMSNEHFDAGGLKCEVVND